MNKHEKLAAAGTSEGAKKAWDTRGRGKKGQTAKTKPNPKQVKQAIKLYSAIGVAIAGAHRKLEHPESVRSTLGKFAHLLKSVGSWIEAGSALAGIHAAITAVMNSGSGHLMLNALSWAHQQLTPIIAHVASSMNFSAEEIEAASQFGDTGWQYGRGIARSVGYVPTRTYGGFPTSRGTGGPGKTGGLRRGTGTMRRAATPKGHSVKGPSVHRPNPSGHVGFNVRKPNVSMHRLDNSGTSEGAIKGWEVKGRKVRTAPALLRAYGYKDLGGGKWERSDGHVVYYARKYQDWSHYRPGSDYKSKEDMGLSTLADHLSAIHVKEMKADIGGEPMTGNMGHAHIDPVTWFHPPSLLKRNSNESLRIPTDDPGESKDSFMDKTQRDDPKTQEFRMKILKRSAPGGLPAQIPARTTLLSPHSGTYMPTGTGMYGAARAARSRRLGFADKRGMFTSFKNQGRI